ncbi:MAG: hypothetical protein IJX99_00105 [Clostridia bacterium]|nr:hypothetical protein [Clostridia bacterium]
MKFKLTLNSNEPVVGDVFYTVPTTEEIRKAEKIVIDLCNERITEVYKESGQEVQRIVRDCLNNEIEKMCATETAYYFLILKEIAELSQEEGYPIITHGNLPGSIISYLLGITGYEPLSVGVENYVPEPIWGTDINITIPDFTVGIAQQIRPLIHERLDAKYSDVACVNDIFKQIPLIDVKTCEILGTLSKETGKQPLISDFNSAVYNHVARNFNQRKSMSNLNNQNFFVTRDEFFKNLVCHNVPADVALDIVKKGVRSTGAKREKYIKTLDEYNVPEYIKNYFSDVTHLWVSADCVGRLLHKCYMAWYHENFPTEFEMLNQLKNE